MPPFLPRFMGEPNLDDAAKRGLRRDVQRRAQDAVGGASSTWPSARLFHPTSWIVSRAGARDPEQPELNKRHFDRAGVGEHEHSRGTSQAGLGWQPNDE